MYHILLLMSLFGRVWCSQPDAPSPIAAPLRDLNWGQLNILHTTDVHGWLGGHLQEPNYSADWGDYISFAQHMHDKADANDVDLVLVDTGDRIEGNGLYDASEPKGEYTFDIVKEQQIDLICSGNHELYKANSSNNELYQTVPNFKDNYLASNLDIYNPENGELEPLAQRYRKFKTKNKGFRILAFGFLFDFTGNANNTVVRTVEDTVKEKWFQEAIRDKDVDVIVVIGHVPVRSKEYDLLYKTIREVQWDTPITFLGGHTHIRDYKVYDRKTVALESGRYMETIGWLSVNNLKSQKPSFSRRYIDNNLFSLFHHSNKTEDTFHTGHGHNVSMHIHEARKALSLDKRHGCAPHDLWVNRAPYPHNSSIFSWLEQRVLPEQLSTAARMTEGRKALVISNTGAMRFDIFQGPFTKDTTFLVSPFTSCFRYLKDVPCSAAKRVLSLLNNEGPIIQEMTQGTGLQAWMLAPPEQMAIREGRVDVVKEENGWQTVTRGDQRVLSEQTEGRELTLGYTTHDDDGSDGDDTLHSEIKFYAVPNCIQATIGFSSKNSSPSDLGDAHADEDPKVVDVVYNEFIQPWVLLALQYTGLKYNESDTEAYMEGKSMTSVITDWVKEHWDVRGESCP